MLRSLRQKVSTDKAFFVIINVVVNILVILRSYIFMKTLSYTGLGIITLLQSVVLLISTMQFGVINGGYRLLCTENEEGAKKINSFFYAFVCCITGISIAIGCLALLTTKGQEYFFVLICGIVAGVFTIIKTWITNQMIAMVMLRKLNFINFVSTIVSILVLAFIPINALTACLVSILIQPIAFVIYLLVVEKSLRPVSLLFSIDILKRVLANGFVIFLTSVFLLINTQIERWSIVSALGIESLGHFYLALLFINVVGLIPSSLDSIYLPLALKAHAEKQYASMQNALSQYFRITVLYSVIVILSVALFAQLLINLFLSKYSGDLMYVYLVLPGLIIFTLSNPFGIVFNVVIQYRFYFRAYFLGSIATGLLVLLYMYGIHSFSLNILCIIKTIAYLVMSLVIFGGYYTLMKQYPELRFRLTLKAK